jgi:hypothetical protein
VARRQALLSKRLTRSHLEAIGLVAASWSSLEAMMLECISKLTGIHVLEVTVLAAPAAFASWCDMLIVICREKEQHKHKLDELEKLIGLLKKLQTLRNYIVHATWLPYTHGKAIVDRLLDRGIASAHDKALAFGLPKRGQKIMLKIKWTAPQMRTVAELTHKSSTMLRGICHQSTPASPAELLGHEGLKKTNLGRILAMLNRLPDPFQP